MAVQFHCVACGRPVEIDDEWAGRLVECPYCHDTITAPAYSTAASTPPTGAARPEYPTRPTAIPGATAAATEALPYYGGTPQPAAARRGNRLAVLALVLVVTALVLGLGAMVGFAIAITNALGANPTPEQADAFVQKAIQETAPWLIKVGLVSLAATGLWLIGVICGIIAVCRQPRGVAIAALIVAAVPFVLMALAVVFAS